MAIASWNARQRPRLEEEEENPLVADVATARQGGWSFRGEAVPGPDSVQYDCWVSTHLTFSGGKLLFVRRTSIMTLMRWGPRHIKSPQVSPIKARQMYITTAQVQEIVVNFLKVYKNNIGFSAAMFWPLAGWKSSPFWFGAGTGACCNSVSVSNTASPCKHFRWHGFVQDSQREQPIEMRGCDVVRSGAEAAAQVTWRGRGPPGSRRGHSRARRVK